MPQAAQIQQAVHAVNARRFYFQIVGKNLHHRRRHADVYLKPHGIAKAPLPDCLFDGFQQIIGLEFLDRHFSVTRYMEHVRLNNLEAGKKMMEVGND